MVRYAYIIHAVLGLLVVVEAVPFNPPKPSSPTPSRKSTASRKSLSSVFDALGRMFSPDPNREWETNIPVPELPPWSVSQSREGSSSNLSTPLASRPLGNSVSKSISQPINLPSLTSARKPFEAVSRPQDSASESAAPSARPPLKGSNLDLSIPPVSQSHDGSSLDPSTLSTSLPLVNSGLTSPSRPTPLNSKQFDPELYGLLSQRPPEENVPETTSQLTDLPIQNNAASSVPQTISPPIENPLLRSNSKSIRLPVSRSSSAISSWPANLRIRNPAPGSFTSQNSQPRETLHPSSHALPSHPPFLRPASDSSSETDTQLLEGSSSDVSSQLDRQHFNGFGSHGSSQQADPAISISNSDIFPRPTREFCDGSAQQQEFWPGSSLCNAPLPESTSQSDRKSSRKSTLKRFIKPISRRLKKLIPGAPSQSDSSPPEESDSKPLTPPVGWYRKEHVPGTPSSSNSQTFWGSNSEPVTSPASWTGEEYMPETPSQLDSLSIDEKDRSAHWSLIFDYINGYNPESTSQTDSPPIDVNDLANRLSSASMFLDGYDLGTPQSDSPLLGHRKSNSQFTNTSLLPIGSRHSDASAIDKTLSADNVENTASQ